MLRLGWHWPRLQIANQLKKYAVWIDGMNDAAGVFISA
jgi:hypothetical protein